MLIRIILVLFTAGIVAACSADGGDREPPVCHPPGVSSPYTSSFLDLELVDPLRPEPLQVRIALPNDESGAPYPLIVLSHALAFYPEAYDELASLLASQGFVVMGAKHQDSAEFAIQKVVQKCEEIPIDEQGTRVSELILSLFEPNHPVNRIHDISNLIDHAEELNRSDDTLKGIIDLSRIGVVGHSFGGFTGLAIGGSQLDLNGISTACQGDPDNWLVDMLTGGPLLYCYFFNSVEDSVLNNPPDLSDERISALVNIAGPTELIWGPQLSGLGAIPHPVLMIYTTTDATVKYETGAVPAYAAIGQPKYFFSLKGGSHGNFGYLDPEVFEDLIAPIPDECNYKQFVGLFVGIGAAEPELPAEEQRRLTNLATSAFLQHHVAGATGCEAFLSQDYYETEGGDVQEFEASIP